MEVIAALALLAIVGVASYSVTSAGINASEPVRRALATTTRLIQTDDAVRRFAGKILIPYWVRDVAFETKDEVYRIPYYEGKRESVLELTNKDKALSLSSLSGQISLENVSVESVKPLNGTAQGTHGIIVVYRIAGKEYTTVASFGSYSVVVGK